MAVTGIDAPEVGKELDQKAKTATAGVTLSSVTWTPEDTVAVEATVYTAILTARVDDNHAFANGATATVSGVAASVTAKKNGTLSISLTFDKMDLTPVTIEAADQEVTWKKAAIRIPPKGMFTVPAKAGAATYSVTNGTGEGTYADGKLTIIRCGTFTITVNTAETETHAAGVASAILTVNPEVIVIVVAPEAKELTWTGKAQELITAGEAEGGKMLYALGKDAAKAPTDGWSKDIPTGIEAGPYYCGGTLKFI